MWEGRGDSWHFEVGRPVLRVAHVGTGGAAGGKSGIQGSSGQEVVMHMSDVAGPNKCSVAIA